MTRLIAGALIWAILAVSPAFADQPYGRMAPDRWTPHSKVGVLDRVTLRMHWYEKVADLREAASEHDVLPRHLHGFALLRRSAETGEWVCDVFVVRMTGALVDNDRTVTFGHEMLHCFGLSHD